MSNHRVYQFLKDAGTFYVATVDANQAHVRPFATVLLYEDDLYILTNSQTNCGKQLQNPNNRIAISTLAGHRWIRLTATPIFEDRLEVAKIILDSNPDLIELFDQEERADIISIKLIDIEATIYSFTEDPEVLEF